MDLTSGTPLWPTVVGLPAVYPRLQQDLRCDLAVIGGGITGALVAHRFALAGIHTVLLEADEIGRGSTAATTALIQYEIDQHLCDLIDQKGESAALRSYELCQEAVRGIERLALQHGDSCGFQRKKSLYLASRPKDRQVLEEEYSARRRAGIEVDLLTTAMADSCERVPCVRRLGARTVGYASDEYMDVYRLLLALVDLAHAAV